MICFGLLCSMITPFFIVPDEYGHSIRSEMVSHGSLRPECINRSYFVSVNFFEGVNVKGIIFDSPDLLTSPPDR